MRTCDLHWSRVARMFERSISANKVRQVIATGETVVRYLEDQPYESDLLVAAVNGRALHVVAADGLQGGCIVITVYEPNTDEWESDFRKRRIK